MTLDYTLEGFNLHQPDVGFRLLEGSEFATDVAPRHVDISIPNAHGQVPRWNDLLSPSTLILRVRIEGEDAHDLESKWNHLRTLCRIANNNPVTVRRVVDSDIRSAYMQLQSMTRPDFYCAVHMVTTTMTFLNPSGRWQDVDEIDQELTLDGAAQNVTIASESTAPNTNSKARLAGPVSSVTVRDNTSDTGFTWQGSTPIPVGEYLLVDCATFTAWRKPNDAWENSGTDVSAGLTFEGDGILALVPIPSFVLGNSTSSISVETTGTDSNSDIVIRGRRTYI